MTEQAADTTLPETAPPTPQEPPMQKFLLRQAREQVGMHLAAVAVTLKVPVSRLEALEAGRYDELPDPTFVRALAKSVCKVLKVDPEPILATLPSAHVADLGPTATAISTPMPMSRSGTIMTSSESMVRVPSAVLVAAGLVVLALVLWLWLPERPMVNGQESTPNAVEPKVENDAAAPTEVANEVAVDANAALPLVVDAVVQPVEPTVEVTPTVGPQVAQGVVQVIASDTAWIQVIGASERVLMQRSLDAQESVAFSGDLPISVVIGRADQVTVRVRGQAFDLQPWTRANVARFEVQ
jgi:cytoskeleton protein RodZ